MTAATREVGVPRAASHAVFPIPTAPPTMLERQGEVDIETKALEATDAIMAPGLLALQERREREGPLSPTMNYAERT